MKSKIIYVMIFLMTTVIFSSTGTAGNCCEKISSCRPPDKPVAGMEAEDSFDLLHSSFFLLKF